MMLALKHNSFGPLGGAAPSFWEPLIKPMIIFIVVTALLLSYFQPRPLFSRSLTMTIGRSFLYLFCDDYFDFIYFKIFGIKLRYSFFDLSYK